MSPDVRSIIRGLMIGGGIAVVLMTFFLVTGFFPPDQQPAPTTQIETPENVSFALDMTPMSTPTSASEPLASPMPNAEEILAAQILQSLSEYGGDWNILIRADGNRDIFSYNADRKNHIASIIKVPIAMLFFRSLEEKSIQPSEYANYLSTRGIGRTYMQLLKAMLVDSEEAATGILRGYIADSKLDVSAALRSWGAPNTNISNRNSTPEDIAALYESLYFGDVITPEGRQIILDLLSAYTPNDETRLGVLHLFLPSGGNFYNKRGSVVEGRLIIGDSGLLTWNQNGQEKVYALVILGYNGEIPTTDVKLERGIVSVANLFWEYVISANK